MRIHPRVLELQGAEPRIHLALNALQKEHKLTDLEMMRAVHKWIGTRLDYFIKHEREETNV